MPKLVKRYARSRLYDTEAARYVTLADLQEWQARGLAFTVLEREVIAKRIIDLARAGVIDAEALRDRVVQEARLPPP